MVDLLAECDIVPDVLRALSAVSGVRVWRQSSGLALSLDGKRPIRMGVVGAADVTGLCGDGRRIEVEVKTYRPGSKQRLSQLRFEAMILKHNGIYFVARSGAEAVRKLLAFTNPQE